MTAAAAAPRAGPARRIGALVLRFLLLLRRDPARVVDAFYWPLIDVVLWGLVTWFVIARGIQLPGALGVFLGAIILWNVFFRICQDVSVSFLDDIWARSTVTLFSSPLTLGEFAAAVILLGLIKVAFSLLSMAFAAWLLFAFDLFSLGFALLPFAANLVLFGWSVGLVCMSIILRFGGRWAIVAWSLPVLLMPFSSVLYPESVLPPLARAIARAVPANHVFEGMRALLIERRMAWDRLWIATAENAVYLVLAAALVAFTFRVALRRGLLPKLH